MSYFVLWSVAKRVVNTQQKFNGNTLEVKSLGTETMKKLRNKESSEEKESTTVEVCGLPDGSTENSVHIHFQKKKNGGGEVKKVEMLGDGKARVIFEDPRGRFCNMSHILFRSFKSTQNKSFTKVLDIVSGLMFFNIHVP